MQSTIAASKETGCRTALLGSTVVRKRNSNIDRYTTGVMTSIFGHFMLYFVVVDAFGVIQGSTVQLEQIILCRIAIF